MTDIRKIEVEIFGEKHVIRGEGSEEHILELARAVDDKMHQIARRSPRLSLHQVAILTALNFADDLLKLQEEQEALLQLLDEKTE
ncbi:cell division protein ZapA [Peptococcaceae bacterium CEB3]|nr:cell division protein ZapA [Peptococcaceae bacterium CEB3]